MRRESCRKQVGSTLCWSDVGLRGLEPRVGTGTSEQSGDSHGAHCHVLPRLLQRRAEVTSPSLVPQGLSQTASSFLKMSRFQMCSKVTVRQGHAPGRLCVLLVASLFLELKTWRFFPLKVTALLCKEWVVLDYLIVLFRCKKAGV